MSVKDMNTCQQFHADRINNIGSYSYIGSYECFNDLKMFRSLTWPHLDVLNTLRLMLRIYICCLHKNGANLLREGLWYMTTMHCHP